MDFYVKNQTPTIALSFEDGQPNRRTANFHPSVWGDYFLSYASGDKENSCEQGQEHERLKEEVRKMLIRTPDTSCHKLELIDSIQRLGVSYHFESEIEASLLSMLEVHLEHDEDYGNDLRMVSLRFRLLRQHGHYVSSDVFKKFKDSNGNFKESLARNIEGLLSLYEAANYSVPDEDILEEALNFTTAQFQCMLPNLSNFLATQVNQALDVPILKSMNRVGVRQFISLYEQHKSRNTVLLNFAKYDFNILQKLHQKELSSITKWWKDLDCLTNSPFVRDRVVEGYHWILGIYFEVKYSIARTTLTKLIALTSIIDDIYDVHGTFDELILITDSMERMDASGLDQLPWYARHLYRALLEMYSEMEEQLAMAGKSNLVNYAISSMKMLARSYMEEAKWYQNSGRVPNFEEYMEVAIESAGHHMIATHSLVCVGELVTEDVVDWLFKNPLIMNASSVIGRLMNDIAGHEEEKERGESMSAVECYAKQYGTSTEEAIDELQKQVRNAWKDTNKECLLIGPTPAVPTFVLEVILNFSRVAHFHYWGLFDGYTHSYNKKIKDLIASVLVDPVPM